MFLFVALWMNVCAAGAHPLYVSVTNMDVDARHGSVVLSIRMFMDDLETVLHNKYGVDGWIGTRAEHSNGRQLLVEYVNERFGVEVNSGERLRLQVDSMQIVEDSMWFHMSGRVHTAISSMVIDNRLLTDFFSRQNNLVIINTGKNENGYRLDRKKDKILLSL